MKIGNALVLLAAAFVFSACQNKQKFSSSAVSTVQSASSVVSNIPASPIGVIRTNPTTAMGIVPKPTFRVNFGALPNSGYKVHLYRISCNSNYLIGTATPNVFSTSALITSAFTLPVTSTAVKFFANIEYNGKFSACSNSFAEYRYQTNTASESTTTNDATEIQIKEDGKMEAIDNATSSLWDATWNLILPSAYAAPKVYKKSQHKIYFQDQLRKGLSDQLGEEKFKDLVKQRNIYLQTLNKDPSAAEPEDLKAKVTLRFSKSPNTPSITLTANQVLYNQASVITFAKKAYYGIAVLGAKGTTPAINLSDLKDGSIFAIGSTLVVMGGKDSDGKMNLKFSMIYLNDENDRFKITQYQLLSTKVENASHFKIVPVDKDLAKKLNVPDDKIKQVVGKCVFRVVITTKNEVKEPRLLQIPEMIKSCPQVSTTDLDALPSDQFKDDVS